MLERLKAAIPLIILFALSFILSEPYCDLFFTLLACAGMFIAVHEAYAMMAIEGGCTRFKICSEIFSVLSPLVLLGSRYIFPINNGILIALLCCLYILTSFCLLFQRGVSRENLNALLVSLGIFMYINWTLFYVLKLFFLGGVQGRYLLLALVMITKMGDVGAYFIGSLSHTLMHGNHKLAPVISPKKSWEGLAGGILFSVGTALLISYYFPNLIATTREIPLFSTGELIFIGIVAAVVGLIGDLAESVIKRVANVKDSGHLPGIGGILDVLDSLILVAPLFYVYVMLKLS